MDFAIFYAAIVVLGIFFVFMLEAGIEDIRRREFRVALRIGILFAWPLVFLVGLFLHIFEIKL